MSDKKMETVQIGSYLLAKNGTTKYLKLEASPKADQETKARIAKVIELLGTDVIYVNLFDQDFKEKFKVPDFVKGRIQIEKKDGPATKGKSDVDF